MVALNYCCMCKRSLLRLADGLGSSGWRSSTGDVHHARRTVSTSLSGRPARAPSRRARLAEAVDVGREAAHLRSPLCLYYMQSCSSTSRERASTSSSTCCPPPFRRQLCLMHAQRDELALEARLYEKTRANTDGRGKDRKTRFTCIGTMEMMLGN